MEFAWCEFAQGSMHPGNVFCKSMNRIRLFPQASGGKVKFNWDEAGGRWWYDVNNKLMFIEFKSQWHKPSVPNRQHAFRERDDGSFQLIPYDDNEIYNNSAGIWTPGTVAHYNKNVIVLQKIKLPE